MNFENGIQLCKKEIAEYSKNINPEDVKWVKKKLIEYYTSDFKGYDKNPEVEYSLLNLLAEMLYAIMSNKPKNIKLFVEIRLKEKSHDVELKSFMSRSISLNLGDEKKGDEITNDLSKFLKKVKKEIPDFEEKRSRTISEIYGDVMAIKSKGKRGSARMLNKLLSQVTRKELEEKKDKK